MSSNLPYIYFVWGSMTDAITGCTKMLTSAGFGEVKLRRSESRLTPGLAIQTDQGARTFTFFAWRRRQLRMLAPWRCRILNAYSMRPALTTAHQITSLSNI